MAALRFSEAEHARVTAAVAEAERSTDGEIVTIVTGLSDPYRDVALHYAVAAMLLVPALCGVFPALLAGLERGWDAGLDVPRIMLAVMIAEALLFLALRYGLAWTPLLMRVTPPRTKARRVRARAVQFFKASAEQRTGARVGILLYLSLAEHRAEIIADEAIHGRVPEERWGEAMAALIDGIRAGDAAGGMAAAVARIGQVLAEQFPKTDADVNELPDRLIEL